MPQMEVAFLVREYMERYRAMAAEPSEWNRTVGEMAVELEARPRTSPLTPLERICLYCLSGVGMEKHCVEAPRMLLGRYIELWPEDFSLRFMETEICNYLGVESASRNLLMSELIQPPLPVDKPSFEMFRSANSPAPVFSIAISTWNRLDSLRRFLDSLRAGTRVAHEIVVYDNRSTDGTQDYLRHLQREYPDLVVILSSSHRSTPHAYRLAFQIARGEMVGALADDTEVLPGWETPLVDALRSDSSVGVASPLVLDGEGRVDTLGSCVPYVSRRFSWMNRHGPLPYTLGVRPEEAGLPTRPVETEGGAYPFLRRDVLSKIGIFDARFAHVWDNDLAIETWAGGLRTITCCSSWVVDRRVEHVAAGRNPDSRDDLEFPTHLFFTPDEARNQLRSPENAVMKYYRDDFLLQSKWWVSRIQPCNRQ